MGWRDDLPGAALLSGVFVGLLVAAELWRRFGHPRPEWTRKLVHLGGGLACLLFPFLVHSPWVVLAMALPLTAVFALGGRLGFLRSLHGIDRPSRGVEYYPLSVFLVFLLARDRPWIYVSALLVLAIGDAGAALIGSRYGVLRYQVEDEHKSVEGSAVFLVIAFLAIHLPLLLATDLPRPLCVLAALLVATLLTGFEAISLRGADNLFVPLAAVVMLGKITTKPLEEVEFQALSLAAICIAIAILVWRTHLFNAGGTIVFILFAYGAWSLGNWQWALPAFSGFAGYLAMWTWLFRDESPRGARVRTVARALLPPFCVLLAANVSRFCYQPAYGPFVAACGAVLAFGIAPWMLARLRRGSRPNPPHWLPRALAGAAAGAIAAALTAVAPWLTQRLPLSALLGVAAAVVAAAAAGAAADRVGGSPAAARKHPRWTARLFLLSFVAAVLVVALQGAGLAATWRPVATSTGLDALRFSP